MRPEKLPRGSGEDNVSTDQVQLNSTDYRLNGHHGNQGNGSAIQSDALTSSGTRGNLSITSSTQSLTALIRGGDSTGSGLDTSSDGPVVKQLNRSNTAKDYEHLKFTFIQAVALNTLNMFGTGPFITLPLLIESSDPKGPHALIGYSIAGLISMFDSTVWGELGSLMPYSGATYVYLREAYGRETWGRFMSFMFIWQFLLSGPLEIASGFIAMAQYVGYIFEMNYWQTSLLGCLFCLISVGILHGDINAVSKWTVGLWLVTIGSIVSTLVSGFAYFDSDNLKSPPDAFSNMGTLIVSLGTAARIGLYDFSGYQDVCMIGDEVKDAKRNIPRACVITCVVVSVVYIAVYLAVLGYLPWDGPEGFVQMMEENDSTGNYIMSIFYERMVNKGFAIFFTLVVIVTIFGSCFSLLLGYAQIPYASARDGCFFQWFGHEHQTKKGLADHALLTLGVVSAMCCFLDLSDLINSMLIPRLVLLYITQTIGLVILRYKPGFGDRTDVYRCPWYPLPVIVNLFGFTYCFVTSDNWFISGNKPLMDLSILYCLIGAVVYFLWARQQKFWPYERKGAYEDTSTRSDASDADLVRSSRGKEEKAYDDSALGKRNPKSGKGKETGAAGEVDEKRHNDKTVELEEMAEYRKSPKDEIKETYRLGDVCVQNNPTYGLRTPETATPEVGTPGKVRTPGQMTPPSEDPLNLTALLNIKSQLDLFDTGSITPRNNVGNNVDNDLDHPQPEPQIDDAEGLPHQYVLDASDMNSEVSFISARSAATTAAGDLDLRLPPDLMRGVAPSKTSELSSTMGLDDLGLDDSLRIADRLRVTNPSNLSGVVSQL